MEVRYPSRELPLAVEVALPKLPLSESLPTVVNEAEARSLFEVEWRVEPMCRLSGWMISQKVVKSMRPVLVVSSMRKRYSAWPRVTLGQPQVAR